MIHKLNKKTNPPLAEAFGRVEKVGRRINRRASLWFCRLEHCISRLRQEQTRGLVLVLRTSSEPVLELDLNPIQSMKATAMKAYSLCSRRPHKGGMSELNNYIMPYFFCQSLFIKKRDLPSLYFQGLSSGRCLGLLLAVALTIGYQFFI